MRSATASAARAEQALVDAEVRTTTRDSTWPRSRGAIIEKASRLTVETTAFLSRLRTYLDSASD